MVENKKIELSVVIPVYNAERTLAKSVESIVSQDALGVEIILVDDGSRKECADLCDGLAEESELIRVIHKENGGSLTARVAGIGEARGEYVMFVDSDDTVSPGAIARIRSELDSDTDIFLYDYSVEYLDSGKSKVVKTLDCTETVSFEGEGLKEIYEAFMGERMNTMCATVFRLDAIREIEIPKSEVKLTYGEDRLQKLMCLLSAKKIKYIPHSFYNYLLNETSQSAASRAGNFSQARYLQTKEILLEERKYYPSLGLTNEDICRQDGRELGRIIRLAENAYARNKFSKDTLKEVMDFLASDSLFCEFARIDCLVGTRKHIQKSVRLILKRRIIALGVYWRTCELIRRIKYSKR